MSHVSTSPGRVPSRDRPVHGWAVSLTEPESLSAGWNIGRKMLVQATGLMKDYPRIRALDQVSLEIHEGEVFGLFGPNGAGKTTCLRVLSGLTRPTGGQATVCGADVRTQPNEVRKRIGRRTTFGTWAAGGGAIFFTSHNLLESEAIVDRYAFIHRGRIVALGSARELKETLLAPAYQLEVGDVERAMTVLEPIPHQTLERSGPGLIRIGLLARRDAARIARALTEAGIDLLEMKSLGTMEDVYSRITVGTPQAPPGGAS